MLSQSSSAFTLDDSDPTRHGKRTGITLLLETPMGRSGRQTTLRVNLPDEPLDDQGSSVSVVESETWSLLFENSERQPKVASAVIPEPEAVSLRELIFATQFRVPRSYVDDAITVVDGGATKLTIGSGAAKIVFTWELYPDDPLPEWMPLVRAIEAMSQFLQTR